MSFFLAFKKTKIKTFSKRLKTLYDKGLISSQGHFNLHRVGV